MVTFINLQKGYKGFVLSLVDSCLLFHLFIHQVRKRPITFHLGWKECQHHFTTALSVHIYTRVFSISKTNLWILAVRMRLIRPNKKKKVV